MSKKIKILWISLLSALCALCMAALALPSFFAKADTIEVTTTGINDGNFSFVPGAYIPKTLFEEDPNGENFDLKTARTQLRFDFKLENFDYENLADSVPHAHPWFSSSLASPNVFIYEFTLLRGNHDGDGAGSLMTADEQYSVLVVIFPDAHKNFYGYVAIKDFYTNNLLISNGYAGGFLNGTYISNNSQKDYDNIATDGDYYNYDGVRRYFGKGYKITYKFRLTNNNLFSLIRFFSFLKNHIFNHHFLYLCNIISFFSQNFKSL